jgi:gentisate 1,2-dioxygenase
MTTEFLDGSKIEAKEGDILIFPSYKYHRSKKNNSKKIKTIIAFNVSFDVWNGKKI